MSQWERLREQGSLLRGVGALGCALNEHLGRVVCLKPNVCLGEVEACFRHQSVATGALGAGSKDAASLLLQLPLFFCLSP